MWRASGWNVLLPVRADEETRAFIERFPHLHHHRWRDGIFHEQRCEFADIRHAFRRIHALQDKQTEARIAMASWEDGDALDPVLALLIGRYPAADENIPDYKSAIQRAFKVAEVKIEPGAENSRLSP